MVVPLGVHLVLNKTENIPQVNRVWLFPISVVLHHNLPLAYGRFAAVHMPERPHDPSYLEKKNKKKRCI